MVFNVIMEIQDKLKHLINPMVFFPYLRLCLIYTVYGGGFLVSKDLHSSTHVTTNIPYDKTKTSKQICYTYDSVAPIHCSQNGTCTLEPMTLSKRLTSSRVITVNIGGWFDPYPTNGHPSIATYSIELKDFR
jgi:hypothetical protein